MLTPEQLAENRKTVSDGWSLRPSEGAALLQHIEEQAAETERLTDRVRELESLVKCVGGAYYA